MSSFVVDGRLVGEGRMPAVLVVPVFVPLKHRHRCFRLRLESAPGQQLALKRGEEPLRHRIVERISHRSHLRHNSGFLTALAEGVTGVLRVTVRVMDNALGTTLPECHLQPLEDQLGSRVRFDRPPDNAGIHIQHHRQIHKAGPGRDVRDVGHLQPIRFVRVEALIYQVHGSRSPWVGCRGHHEAPQARSQKTHGLYQSSDPLATYARIMVVSQLCVDHPRAVHSTRAAVDRLDLPSQPQIRSCPSTRRSTAPDVESTPRNLEHAAHDPHRMDGLIRLREPEERFELLPLVANQAAAPGRISGFSLSLRFSRRSRADSSRYVLISPPSPLSSSRGSCFTHSAMVQDVGPNSFASETGVRPERTRSTICCLNSRVYRVALLATVNASKSYLEVSTQPGQVHYYGIVPMPTLPPRLSNSVSEPRAWLRPG